MEISERREIVNVELVDVSKNVSKNVLRKQGQICTLHTSLLAFFRLWSLKAHQKFGFGYSFVDKCFRRSGVLPAEIS